MKPYFIPKDKKHIPIYKDRWFKMECDIGRYYYHGWFRAGEVVYVHKDNDKNADRILFQFLRTIDALKKAEVTL